MSKILINTLHSSLRRTLRNESLKSHNPLRHLGVSTALCTKTELTTKSSSQKKTKEIPKVTLIQQNQGISVTTLEEAQKLARRRDLQLVKVQEFDPKSQRPVYRLAKAAELLSEDFGEPKTLKSFSSNASSTKKSEKSLTINCRISDNDLASRLKNITKWLAKGNEVRIMIQGGNDDGKSSEKIMLKIETTIKEPELIGKITQKRVKDNFIKFIILPVVPVVVVKEPESQSA